MSHKESLLHLFVCFHNKAVDEAGTWLPRPLGDIMDRWILQMGFPLITIDTQTGNITQKHFLLDPESVVTRPSEFKQGLVSNGPLVHLLDIHNISYIRLNQTILLLHFLFTFMCGSMDVVQAMSGLSPLPGLKLVEPNNNTGFSAKKVRQSQNKESTTSFISEVLCIMTYLQRYGPFQLFKSD